MLSAAARRLPSAALTRSSLRTLSVSSARSYGNLPDEDRIFQNLYGRHDWGVKGAEKRVRVGQEGEGDGEKAAETQKENVCE